MSIYKGINKHANLGDGTTKDHIDGIRIISIETDKDHKIRFHNIIYVSIIDISLFSEKQHITYVAC